MKYDKKNKLAAMFGLDARIALAVFGALSIITGATLYSVLSNIEAITTLTELQELGKAWKAYYLDVRKNLPPMVKDNTNNLFYVLKSSELVDSSAKGWRGPYISYKKHSTDSNLVKDSVAVHLMLLTSNDWTIDGWGANVCTSGKECSIYARFYYLNTNEESLAIKIDKIVDDSDGKNKGDFRWHAYTDSQIGINLKIAPIANPND